MRLKVSRARSGLHGGGVGSDGAVRTSSLGGSCEAQWAESLQECRERGEQEPRIRRKAHTDPALRQPVNPSIAALRELPRSGTGRTGAVAASFTLPRDDASGPGIRFSVTAFSRA